MVSKAVVRRCEELKNRLYQTSLYAGFFTIVNNEKNHLKNDDKTENTHFWLKIHEWSAIPNQIKAGTTFKFSLNLTLILHSDWTIPIYVVLVP